MKKVGFRLHSEDGWPPYDVEFLWVEQERELLRLKSFPFFVNGTAFDDLIRVTNWAGEEAEKWEIVEESGNSTVWIIAHEDVSNVLERLGELGCGYEGAPLKSLYSVNVPPSLDKAEVESVLNYYESSGIISVAYPAFRDDSG